MIGENVRILDCTLRDGGYYNNWDFDRSLVEDYLLHMARGGVDFVELGFRFTDQSRFYGPYAYTSDEFLETLDLPEGPTYGVMLNASDYVVENGLDLLAKAFRPARESKISLVRIAAHIHQVTRCREIVAYLKELGYLVGLNIMQISQADDAKVKELVTGIEQDFVDFEALYFADSLGNLRPDDIVRLVGLFRENSTKEVGFHGHDNIGLGVTNSLTSIAEGATWIDATITGMGRGAGNTQTEYLAMELENRGFPRLNTMHINQIATDGFSQMQKDYGWGTNIFYYKAGLQSVHPTYVQQMLQVGQYEPIDILSMIETICRSGSNLSYKRENITQAFSEFLKHSEGEADLTGAWAGQSVVLVGSGPTVKKHWDAIRALAERRQARVLAINGNNAIDPAKVHGVVCVHPARMMSFLQKSEWRDTTLYTSVSSVPSYMAETITEGRKVVDYGVTIAPDTFEARGGGCTVPAPLAAAVALSIAIASGAKEILVAGFDGFDGKSDAFEEMQLVLDLARQQSAAPIRTLTPTHFDLEVEALYALA